MWVDFHWHARDEEQSHKETIARSLAVAEAAGLDAIAAMPNTERPLITLERCREYLTIARAVQSQVQFYVHIGLTADVEQVKYAIEAYRKEPAIIGMKAYWAHSTGNSGIIREDDQYKVLETLTKEGYDGVLVGHFEKQSLVQENLYDGNLMNWSTQCRPEAAEITSFQDVVTMAEKVKFQGKLHIAHVSTTEVVDSIASYTGSTKLSCGITPHHLFLDCMALKDENSTAWYKCNPPIRNPVTRVGLLERFLAGKISILESDHAPHTWKDKEKEIPASCCIAGPTWPYVIMALEKLGMSAAGIHQTLFQRAVDLYGLDIQPGVRLVQWNILQELQQQYPHDLTRAIVKSLLMRGIDISAAVGTRT